MPKWLPPALCRDGQLTNPVTTDVRPRWTGWETLIFAASAGEWPGGASASQAGCAETAWSGAACVMDMLIYGAPGRTRTSTMLPPPDFESVSGSRDKCLRGHTFYSND